MYILEMELPKYVYENCEGCTRTPFGDTGSALPIKVCISHATKYQISACARFGRLKSISSSRARSNHILCKLVSAIPFYVLRVNLNLHGSTFHVIHTAFHVEWALESWKSLLRRFVILMSTKGVYFPATYYYVHAMAGNRFI